MKKLSLIIILIACTTFAKAQITGGGAMQKQESQEADKSTKKEDNSDMWRAISVSALFANGDFGLYDENVPFEDAVGANTGIGFEIINNRFYYDNAGVKVGLYTSLFGGIHFMNSEYTDDDNTTLLLPVIYSEFKLGPVVSYQLAEGLAIDAFVKFGPTLVVGPIFEAETGNFDTFTYGYGDVGFSLFRFGLGANLRFNNLVLGLSLNPQRIERSLTIDGEEQDVEDMPLGTTRLMVGLKF